jgi:hypothetical protein
MTFENGPLTWVGAPLRNRAIDLLLTIHNSVGSLPGVGVAAQLARPPQSAPALRFGAK